MERELQNLSELGEAVILYGRDVVWALIILVAGLLLSKLLIKYLRVFLRRFIKRNALVSTITTSLHILLIVIVVGGALRYVGVEAVIIRRIFLAVALAAVGLVILVRPYLPSLPYKVGNTIQAGGLLGKVEGTTMLHTRLRALDGKVIFIPNKMILNDIVVNYHFNPKRQIRLVIPIRYSDDLLKAKKVIADIMAEDPRILDNPAARVFVLNLAEMGVELAARPWVSFLDYWRTRCDLLEKIKLRLDHEGITIAVPQREIRLHDQCVCTARIEKDLGEEVELAAS
jgi:small conductance mechanosensitive channel